MKRTFKYIIGIIFILLLTVHIFAVAVFFCPTAKVLSVLMRHDVEYVPLAEIPEHVRQVFKSDGSYDFKFQEEGNVYDVALAKIMNLRVSKFFDDSEREELYLNMFDFGEEITGLQAASKYYFNKSVSELSFEEALTLSGVYKVFLEK